MIRARDSGFREREGREWPLCVYIYTPRLEVLVRGVDTAHRRRDLARGRATGHEALAIRSRKPSRESGRNLGIYG